MRHEGGYFEEKKLGKRYDFRLLARLSPFVSPYRWLLAATLAMVVLITAFDLAMPYVIKIAIDRYIVPGMSRSTADTDPADAPPRLTIKVDDPQARAIMRAHPERFEPQGDNAAITYENLTGLNSEELTVVRAPHLVGILWMALLYLLLSILNFAFTFFQVMLMEMTGQRIMHDMRMKLFNHMQHLTVDFFNRNPVGRLVTRATNDIQNMHEMFTSVVAFVFKDMFLLVGIAAVMLSIHWKLALASFGVVPVVVVASLVFAGHAREAFREMRVKLAEINTRFAETIDGMKVIQLFKQERANQERFSELNHANYLAGMRQIHVFAVFMPLVEVLGTLSVAAIVLYGGSRVLAAQLSLGELVAFLTYIRMFFRPIRDLAEKYNVLQNAMSSAERILLILDNPNLETPPASHRLTQYTPMPAAAVSKPRPQDAAFGNITRLTMQSVSFAYVPGEPVLEEISFEIGTGETLAVVGPTGSGKTTLINLILRFYEPTRGNICINGKNIRQLPLTELRNRLALVTQDPFLFSGSIRDNIVQDRREMDDDTLDHILAISNCAPLVQRLPGGLNTLLAEGGKSLSSGERQLISIARAFARNPELIIFDEATSYIDSGTEQTIQEAMRNLREGRTAILIAHRLSTARGADTILVLNRGRIIERGNHDALMARKGFYYRLNLLKG